MNGDPRFLAVLDEMRALHIRKSADYGSGTDPLANLRAGEEFGVPAWLGATIRMNDKMTRLKAFATNGSLQNEGVEDTFLDLACYAILCLVLFRENA
jgi:hypothetical protein